MVTVHFEPDREAPLSSRFAVLLLVFLTGILLLAAPALLNGVAFFFADSGAYVSGGRAALAEILKLLSAGEAASLPGAPAPVEDVPFRPGPDAPGEPTIKGRSVYYALFAYFGLVTGALWPVVLVQALAIFWLVTLLCRMAFPGAWTWPALAAAAGLAFLTPAGLFAGMVMPDVWAGILILAVAILATVWSGLGRIERPLLLCLVLFAVLSHLSHLLLLVALLLGLAALLPVRHAAGRLVSAPALGLMALCAGAGVAGEIAFAVAVERVTGAPPVSRPHLTAHLVDDGPGVDYVRTACPEAGFAVCAYADRLPMPWTRFLFGRTPEGGELFYTVPPEIKRALAAEDLGFALAVFRSRPVETATFLAADGVEQAGDFSVDRVLAVAPHGLPAPVAETSRTALSARAPWLLSVLTTLSYATAAAGAVLLAAGVLRASTRAPAGADRLVAIAAIVVLGVLGNAAICGMLASVGGRFQARVIWLLPLTGCLLFFGLRHARRSQTLP